MKDINDNVTADLPYDQTYIDWLQKMRQRVAEIERRQNGIKQLVELLDSREGAKSDS